MTTTNTCWRPLTSCLAILAFAVKFLNFDKPMYNFKEHFKVIIAYSARGTLNYAAVLPRIELKRFSGKC